MGPWMGARWTTTRGAGAQRCQRWRMGPRATNDLVRSKIKIKSLNFMRGRTFLNKFVLIDEAQNLTPKQMKTLDHARRPGHQDRLSGQPGADRHALPTEGSSGLTYAVDRFRLAHTAVDAGAASVCGWRTFASNLLMSRGRTKLDGGSGPRRCGPPARRDGAAAAVGSPLRSSPCPRAAAGASPRTCSAPRRSGGGRATAPGGRRPSPRHGLRLENQQPGRAAG